MGHMGTIASSVELNNMSYPYGYANYAQGMGAYGMGGGSSGMLGGNSYAYNPVYWNAISLPGVNSVSSLFHSLFHSFVSSFAFALSHRPLLFLSNWVLTV